MRLQILHTNDVHSNFENFAKAVTKIKELKDDHTLVLDAGDFADFKRMELHGTKGKAALELLEYSGYDAYTIGNNELFCGIDITSYMASVSKVPMISSNVYHLDDQPVQEVKKSVLLNKQGLRILIIGVSPDLGPFNELGGYTIRNYMEAITGELETNRGNYDLCILLSHLGMDYDQEIAQKLEDIHIIIGGHFHLLLQEPITVHNTIILTAGSNGEYLGSLTLEAEQQKVTLLSGETIDVSCCKPDDGILQLLKENKEKAIEVLSEPLYEIDRDLWHDITEENPMTNFLADALRDVLGCELGLINSGILNGGIRKGPVSRKKLIELAPSPLNPTRYELQGSAILEALQCSLDTDVCYADGKGPGFRGKYVGRLHVSNALIELEGRTVANVYINGAKLIPDRWYTVASSDYLQRGTGYPTLSSDKNVTFHKEFIRDTLNDYLSRKEFVKNAFQDRWLSSHL